MYKIALAWVKYSFQYSIISHYKRFDRIRIHKSFNLIELVNLFFYFINQNMCILMYVCMKLKRY